MLRQLATAFRAAPDFALVPDPWLAKPLMVLDRMARDGVDLEELAFEVLQANGRILDLLPEETQRRIEEVVFADEATGDVPFGQENARELARRVRETLGTGFKVEVLRSGHPDWQDWLRKHPSDRQRIVAEAAFRAAAQSVPQVRKGFRQNRRRTRAENANIQFGEMRLTPEEYRQLDEASAAETMVRKVGVATVLMRGGWVGLVDDGTGDEWEQTVDNRLGLLGLRHVGVTDAAEPKVEDDPHRDESGRVVLVGADQIYGPALLGDAITSWLIDAADSLQRGHAEWLEDKAVPLADTPPGSVDILVD